MSLNIVFMGTPEFSVPTLDLLKKNKLNVVRVYTQPPAKSKRGQKVNPTPIERFCIKNKIVISNTCLNGFTVFLQLSTFFNTVKLTSSENNYTNHLTNVAALCRSNKMCEKLVEYIDKRIKKNNDCNMIRDFSNFESLKKYM